MEVMKRLALVLWVPALVGAADLSGVRSVYVAPMFRGLDQYLANTMTNHHVFQVVTDPKLADTFFTDRIGETLEAQLAKLTEQEKPVAEPVKDTVKDKDPKEADSRSMVFGDAVNKLDNPGLNSSFGRGKGTVFLVDVKSRQVIWSAYSPSQSSAGKEMDRTASDIVSRLMKDMGMKKK
jgi:hypothetical protein